MMKVLHVVGARPNYMKTAPTMREMALHHAVFQQVLLHTGQQYDENMSDRFFAQLGMGLPDEFLEVGSGTHAEQTARVMPGFESMVKKHRPDWVFVVGELWDGCAVRASSRLCSVACRGLIG
ncbi:MAG: UDP-N-acetylglucosamine 2-epimerase [Terriglobales bacterium]|jgi:UDP-N-acetylglucosamine 2-epimerase (non-hydrolysing)